MSNTSLVPIPDYMLKQVREYMEKLSVQDKVHSKIIATKTYEVKKVINARFTDNNWQFRIMFKDGTLEWVKDQDCSCEQKIAQYLSHKGIRTAYLFCRVSTKEQASNTSTSLESQKNELFKALSNNPQYKRIRVYNISRSAYKSIPPIMRRVGDAVLPGDSIWIWRVDRLSRNIVKYLSWLENLAAKDIDIYSQSENCHYGKNKLLFIQKILDAQKEAEILGERVKLSYKMKRKRGDEHIGCLPYGKKYQRLLSDDKKKTLRQIVVDNDFEQAILKNIVDSRDKETPKVTADRLNREGKLKKGKCWNSAMVRRCLKIFIVKSEL